MTTVKEAGRAGGRARAARMTPEERSASARKAAKAMWAKRKKLKPEPDKLDEELDLAAWR